MLKLVRGVNGDASRKVLLGLSILCCSLILGGCVVLEEKYNAEKARSLNFQRLLAQEEKRTAELDSEVKRCKNEVAAFEARNRELTAQVQSIRDQLTRLQEEAEAIKEAAALERKVLEDMRKASAQPAKPKTPGRATDLSGDLGGSEIEPHRDAGSRDAASPGEAVAVVKSGTVIHVVKPGETLFRISRRYGVDVDRLKKMNKLPDDIIEVGQKLIVATE